MAAGVNVMALSVAKGLEFDHAVVVGWGNAWAQNARYVAASRGTKTLVLVE